MLSGLSGTAYLALLYTGPAALDGGHDTGTSFWAEHPLGLGFAAGLGFSCRSGRSILYLCPPGLLGGGNASPTFGG